MAGSRGKIVPPEELSYREVQAELKALGLPAKGTADVLRARLAEAREQGDVKEEPEEVEQSEEEQAQPEPPKPSPPIRKSRRLKEDATQRPDETKGAPEGKTSQTEAFLRSTRTPLPAAKARSARKVTDSQAAQTPETPLERAKRVARKSAAELQRSITEFNQEVRRRRLGWVWWLLAAVILALLLGSQWKHAGYWQDRAGAQLQGLKQGTTSLVHVSQVQASRLGESLQQGYRYTSNSVEEGIWRVSRGVHGVREWAAGVGKNALEAAHPYLPKLKVQKTPTGTSACSARVNATELDPIFPDGVAWAGLRASLRDVWAGYNDDPLKGTGVLLAGGSRGGLRTAAAAIEKAVPAECAHCYLHLKGDEELAVGGFDAAGHLQQSLATHLAICPYAIVHIEAVNEVHADALPVLLSALSEQGSLTQNGHQVPAHKALYIGSTLVPESVLAQADETSFADAVKRDLVSQLEAAASPANTLVPAAFRRRWDVVAPIRRSSMRL